MEGAGAPGDPGIQDPEEGRGGAAWTRRSLVWGGTGARDSCLGFGDFQGVFQKARLAVRASGLAATREKVEAPLRVPT